MIYDAMYYVYSFSYVWGLIVYDARKYKHWILRYGLEISPSMANQQKGFKSGFLAWRLKKENYKEGGEI